MSEWLFWTLGVVAIIATFIWWFRKDRARMCKLGWHRESVTMEFPNDASTIYGLECIDCHRVRCSVLYAPRFPTMDYERSSKEARRWLSAKTGKRIGGTFIYFQ